MLLQRVRGAGAPVLALIHMLTGALPYALMVTVYRVRLFQLVTSAPVSSVTSTTIDSVGTGKPWPPNASDGALQPSWIMS